MSRVFITLGGSKNVCHSEQSIEVTKAQWRFNGGSLMCESNWEKRFVWLLPDIHFFFVGFSVSHCNLSLHYNWKPLVPNEITIIMFALFFPYQNVINYFLQSGWVACSMSLTCCFFFFVFFYGILSVNQYLESFYYTFFFFCIYQIQSEPESKDATRWCWYDCVEQT